MSNIAGPLELKNRVGSTRIFEANANITQDSYNAASVLDSNPKSFWVIYSTPYWDHHHTDSSNPDVVKIVDSDDTHSTILRPKIASAQGFNKVSPQCVLFEHSEFRGYGSGFEADEQDITHGFPQGTVDGAFSAIITGGKWSFYTGYNYTGTKISIGGKDELGPGQYDFFTVTNNKVKSMKQQISGNIAGPLKLSNNVGTTQIFEARAHITEDSYNKASVLDSNPKSFWAIYSTPIWDHHHPNDNPNVVKLVDSDKILPTILEPNIVSVQGFNKVSPQCILFEHSQFRGFGSGFQSNQQDITHEFPQGTVDGVSSAIITGGTWSFYTGYNYTGTKINIGGEDELGPGQYDFTSAANDKVKSMKKVGEL